MALALEFSIDTNFVEPLIKVEKINCLKIAHYLSNSRLLRENFQKFDIT